MRPVGTVLTKNKARTSCHDLGPVRTVVNKMTRRNTQQCEVKKKLEYVALNETHIFLFFLFLQGSGGS